MPEEIRWLRPDDAPQYAATVGYAFEVPPDETATYVKHTYDPSIMLGLFQDQDLMSVATMIPYQMLWDGAPVPMGGIASVAAPPEARRRGYTGRLLQACFERMRAAGQAVSALYPFKFEYYRMFGYELASMRAVYKFPPEQLAAFGKAPGCVRRLEPDETAIPVLQPVYDAWAERTHGALVRETRDHWLNGVLRPWSKWARRVAVWAPARDAAPEGFLLYRLEEEAGERVFAVREFIALTPAAQRGLLGFICNHDSQDKWAKLPLPPHDLPLLSLLPDPRSAKATLDPAWMLRLIDLPAALAARRCDPAAPGRLVLRVADATAPWNDGMWLLEAEAGRLSARPATPGAAADAAVDMAALSQLYAGYTGVADLALAGRLQVQDPRAAAALQAWLPRRPAYFAEFF